MIICAQNNFSTAPTQGIDNVKFEKIVKFKHAFLVSFADILFFDTLRFVAQLKYSKIS